MPGRSLSRRKSPRIPTSTHLQVVEDAPDRLVVHIPGGGPQARGLGCFAVIWNLFMLCFTSLCVAFSFGQAQGPPWYFILPFLALFWAVGLGMAWFWLRMRFTRHNVLVEPERLVVQKLFFDRKSLEETAIDADSTVELVERYKQNNTPVYAVAVSGADRTIKFGTSLSDQDKRFLVHKIRLVTRLEEPTEEERQRFIRNFPGNCTACGAPLPQPEPNAVFVACQHCGRSHSGEIASAAPAGEDSVPFDDLAPSNLPPNCGIEVDDTDLQRLILQFPAFAPKWRRVSAGVAGFVALFPAVFFVVIFNMLAIFLGGPFPTLQIAGSLLIGLGLPAAAIIALRRSSVYVELDRERLHCHWKIGPLNFRRELPISEIRQVVLTRKQDDDESLIERRSAKPAIHIGPPADGLGCVVVSATQRVPLTTSAHEEATSRQVAGLVRARLREFGCHV